MIFGPSIVRKVNAEIVAVADSQKLIDSLFNLKILTPRAISRAFAKLRIPATARAIVKVIMV